MASVYMIKNVCSELTEYIGYATLSTSEELSFEFNDEITLDDIIVAADITPSLKLSIFYPSMNQEAVLNNITAKNYFLNSVEVESVANIAGKRWYRLPSRTKLVLKNLGEVARIDLVVLGRPI